MELYFWGFVVAMVVFGGGGGLSVYEGIRALGRPRAVTVLWPNYLVIGVAAVFEGASLAIGWREFNAASWRALRHVTLGGEVQLVKPGVILRRHGNVRVHRRATARTNRRSLVPTCAERREVRYADAATPELRG